MLAYPSDRRKRGRERTAVSRARVNFAGATPAMEPAAEELDDTPYQIRTWPTEQLHGARCCTSSMHRHRPSEK